MKPVDIQFDGPYKGKIEHVGPYPGTGIFVIRFSGPGIYSTTQRLEDPVTDTVLLGAKSKFIENTSEALGNMCDKYWAKIVAALTEMMNNRVWEDGWWLFYQERDFCGNIVGRTHLPLYIENPEAMFWKDGKWHETNPE